MTEQFDQKKRIEDSISKILQVKKEVELLQRQQREVEEESQQYRRMHRNKMKESQAIRREILEVAARQDEPLRFLYSVGIDCFESRGKIYIISKDEDEDIDEKFCCELTTYNLFQPPTL